MPELMVGIEPVSHIGEEIKKIRKLIVDISGKRQRLRFTEECPMIICVVNNYTKTDDLDRFLEQFAGKTGYFDIVIDGLDYFHHEGADRYIIQANVSKTHELQQLQEGIATGMSRFSDGSLMQECLEHELDGFNYTGTELVNIKEYGFPYVGENWSPHINIAVLDQSGFEKTLPRSINTLVNMENLYDFPMKSRLMELTLYRYDHGWTALKRYGFWGH